MGYAIYQIVKNEERFIKLDRMDNFVVHADLNLCEYILSPSEREAELFEKFVL